MAGTTERRHALDIRILENRDTSNVLSLAA